MKKPFILIAVCFSLLANFPIMAQSTNAAISGTVTDSAGALVEAAVVIAQNTKTGVALRTSSNDSGVYQFSSLQPGIYQVSAEKAGFRKLVFHDVTLEIGAKMSLNLELEAGAVTEAISVSAGNDAALGRESTSVGGVINGQMVRDLPLPNRDALGLVLTQAGLIGDNFGGTRIGSLNVTRDGINVMDQRINGGVNSAIFTSVDLVEEVRVITSPADAEFGRGSGQVQIITRSGTNEFHGSVFESHRNTALNANTWFNNLQGLPRNELIRNQFGGRIGGPIRKNKTFFHFLYEGQRIRQKTPVTATVYTQLARQGAFRFFPGVRNGNANALVPTVDLNGNPVRPAAATGDLQSANLFGRDPNRGVMDPSGIVQRNLAVMPLPNNFRVGDGLNTAGFTWIRSSSNDFNNYSVRLDHQFNESHRLSYNYTREGGRNINGFLAQPFPESPGGRSESRDRFHSLQLDSSLSSNVQNQFRIGALRPRLRFFAPWELEGGSDLLPRAGNQLYATVSTLTTDPVNVSNDPQGRISPLYQFADSISWLRGRHSLKGGAEVRFVSTNGFNSFDVLPRANFGAGGVAVQNISNITGIALNSVTAQNLLIDLTGSLGSIRQAFNAPGGANPEFVAGEVKQRTWKQREVSLFFKDDFKVRPNLTLNLGLRYEFYGVPYDDNGKTAALAGGSGGVFGLSGNSFASLFKPGIMGGSPTLVELVGPGSPNENKKLYNNDWNNLGPAVGLSWAVPWFGKDKTVLRMGYGIGYERNSLRILDVVSGDQPGLRSVANFRSGRYLDLTGVSLPLAPVGQPLELVPVTDRSQTVRAFDDNLRTPYYQNWSVSIQRELGRRAWLEVRYVASKGTKLIRGADLNEVNIFETGILEAFLITQAGGNAPLLDRIFMGLNVPGLGVVNGTTRTGSDAVRTISTTAGHLAGTGTGGVGAFANYLNTTTQFTGVPGGLLRRVNLPENFITVNPQFASSRLTANFANSTYHSMQVDVTKRFSGGLSFQSNYTWSRALGEEEGSGQEMLDSYRNMRDRSFDKRLMSFSITHAWRNSGTYELPFGPGRNFLNGRNKVLSRLVSNWQFGGIFNVFSGEPISLGSGVSSFNTFGDNTPTVVGPFPKSTGNVKVTGNGVIYFPGLQQVPDPSIAGLTTKGGVQALSTLRAVADASGRVLLVNPLPGTLGNLARSYLEGPGTFRLDLNLVKRIRITESRNLEFRLTAIDALNHPVWGNPNTDINSTNFGRITTADGNRIVILDLRFNF
jgi:hypothetical protein